MNDLKTENIEIELFLEAIYQQFGYDFRNYNKAHIKRRIYFRMRKMELESVSQLQHKVLHDPETINLILRDFSINVTEMFRDPTFFQKLRDEVFPILNTYPYIKIWLAGCSTGEEIYTIAIMLQEEGLLKRTQIYATDFNSVALDKAKKGIYPVANIKDYTFNYQSYGGKQSFSDYYTARYDSVIFNQELKDHIVFADHNLVTDNVFSEVHLVICRNVLIYFNKTLQNRVINLFTESLIDGGFLGLGSKENLMFMDNFKKYDVIDDKEKIYKKKLV